jgi:hypothetical protein
METNCLSCKWEKENNKVVDDSKSCREWSEITGVSKSAVQKHVRNHSVSNVQFIDLKSKSYFWDFEEDKFEGQSQPFEKSLDETEVTNFIKSKGLDPEEWDYVWRFSEWEAQTKNGGTKILHSIRVSGKRKSQTIDVSLNRDIIDNFVYIAPNKNSETGTFVLVPTDLQLGKVDWQGGTKDTIDQVLSSFHRAKELCLERNPEEICVIDAGDIIENIYSFPAQIGTNDLSLPNQVVVAFDLMLTGLRVLSEVAHVKYVSVPSNHGSHRTSFGKRAGFVQDDWGIALAKILKSSTDFDVLIPEDFEESLVFETSGSSIGVVHSHQAGSPEKIGDWWAKQTHGNMPTSQAHILIAGHWHSFRVQQSGDEKWIFVGPASDRGSSWYANAKGDRASSGMLSFFTKNNFWSDLQIL